MMDDVYIANDYELKFDRARNRAGQYINGATCSWTIKKKHGGAVISFGDVPYVVSSDGQYLVTVDKTVTAQLVENEIYFLDFTFTGPDGEEAFYHREVKARYRS